MQGLRKGGGRSGQSAFSQLWDQQARLSPPPTFSPTSPMTYSPSPKIPFTLLTPVFNLSPLATSTVCSLGNTVTRLPSLLVSPQRTGGRKGPELNEHSVLPQAGGLCLIPSPPCTVPQPFPRSKAVGSTADSPSLSHSFSSRLFDSFVLPLDNPNSSFPQPTSL